MTSEAGEGDASKQSAAAADGEVTRAAGIVAAMTLLSRIAGFIRDQVIVHRFGATRETDVFWLAFTIPNVLRRLVAEGAISVAFVPVYAGVRDREGNDAARLFLSRCTGLVLVFVSVITGLGMAAAPALVWMFGSGFASDEAAFALGVRWTRGLFPYVLLISLVALAGGVLNAHRRFAVPAAAPVLLNVAWIALVLLLGDAFDPPTDVLVAGVLLGGVLQLVVQVPALAKAGLLPRPRFTLRDPHIRELLRRLGPQVLGLAIYQLNVILLRQFASYMPAGQMTYYYNADRLMQFAFGIFGVAIATAALPTMSAQAARSDHAGLLSTWRFSLRLTSFITIPAALGLVAIALPLCATFFLHGKIVWHDVEMIAWTTAAFAPGLIAQGAVRATVQVYYALGNTRTPVWISGVSVVAVLGFGFLLRRYEVVGLAAALSLSSFVQLFLLGLMLRGVVRANAGSPIRLGFLDLAKSHLVQFGLASVACAAAYGVTLFGSFRNGPTALNIVVVTGALTTAMALYGIPAVMLRLPEVEPVVGKIRRRFRRRA